MSRHVRGRSPGHFLAALVAAALLLGAQMAPAAAVEDPTVCPTGGATVLVDFGDLVADGEPALRTACDDDVEGERAAQSIVDAGFELTYATSSAGFVCRVEGLPAEDPCVRAAPADAYWSVWWAGEGGDWVYSTRGVGTLRTPPGGHVALVWHRGAGEAAPPSVSPGAMSEDDGDEAAVSTAPAQQPSQEPDGLPIWVVAAVLSVLATGVAVVAARRRQA